MWTCGELPGAPEAMDEVSETDKGFIGHAAELETSMQLFLQPDLVDVEAAEWDSGVAGDPSSASREKGRRMFDAVVASLVAVLKRYHAGEYDDARVWRKSV